MQGSGTITQSALPKGELAQAFFCVFTGLVKGLAKGYTVSIRAGLGALFSDPPIASGPQRAT